MTDLPRGWRSSRWWQAKAAKILGAPSLEDSLNSANEAWERAKTYLNSDAPTVDESAIIVGNALVQMMALGEALGRDIGVCMSIVCNRIEQGLDPISPDWSKEVEDDFKSDAEVAEDEAKLVEEYRKQEQRSAGPLFAPPSGEIWIDLKDMWDTVESMGDVNLAAGEFAYGLWHKEAPDADALAEGKRTKFKKGVVVLGAPFVKKPSMLLPEKEKGCGDFYILALVDAENLRVRLAGWCPASVIETAKMVEYGPGRTLCRSMSIEGIQPMREKS